MLDQLSRDVRYALRQMRVTPVVTGVALLSLALGIGANTAIFSLLNAMLLKGPAVHEPGQLAELNDTVSNPVWEALRARQDAFTGALAYSTTTFNLARRGPARNARGLLLSGNAFDVLGVQPALGRLFTPDDDRRDGGPTGGAAVLSHGFWQREYGGLPTVIGQTISLNTRPFTIVGVAPARFSGLVVGETFDVAVTINSQAVLRGPSHMLDEPGAYWIFAVGRLAPSHTMRDAETRLRAIQPQIRTATLPAGWSERETSDYLKEPFTLQQAGGFSMVRRRYTQPLLVLMAIVVLVLLIACANLANLLMARAAVRQREMAVRLSVGASRAQLIRQLLIESLLLAAAGTVAGIAVAQAGSRLLVRLMSTDAAPVFLDLTIDWRVLGFSIVVATITGLLFGLAPAFRGTALRPADALRVDTRTAAGGARRFGIAQVLVAGQVALSLMLVFAAALLVRSFAGLATQPLGFDASRLLTIELDMRQLTIDDERQKQTVEAALTRLRQLPGVSSVAAGLITPVSSNTWNVSVSVPGYTASSDRDSRSFFNAVSAGFFSTLGTPLLAGRDFGAQDRKGTDGVAIVNEAFVRKFMPGRHPIGATFRSGTPPSTTDLTIIGLVADAKYRYLREEASPVVFVSMEQRGLGFFNRQLFLRTPLDPESLVPSVTAAIADVNPDVVLRFKPLSHVVGAAMMSERATAILSGFFGALALLLATVGLYGVMSYGVARRRNEIGVRIALGAAPGRVVGMVMRDVGTLTLAGVVIGSAAGLATTRFVTALLYGLSPTDPTTLLIAIATLLSAAIAAGYLPARRAARIDPMSALRQE